MQIDLDFKLQDRANAAIKFLENFSDEFCSDKKNWLFCALSLNALPLTNILSKRFDISYDILFTEILSAPHNNECEIAIIDENSELVIHEELIKSFNINLDYIYTYLNVAYEEEILKRVNKFRKGKRVVSFKDKNILFIDDEANALRVLAGIKSAINMRAKNISYMCAVIPKEMENLLEKNIDKIFYLYSANHYVDNQHYYVKKVKELSDDDALEILKNSDKYLGNDIENKGENK